MSKQQGARFGLLGRNIEPDDPSPPDPERDLPPDDPRSPDPERDLPPDDPSPPDPERDLPPDDPRPPDPDRDLPPDDPDFDDAHCQGHTQALRIAQLGPPKPIGTENTGIPVLEQRYSGDVIVRLSPLIPTSESATLLALAELETVLERFGQPDFGRAITTDRAGGPGADLDDAACGSELGGSLNELERKAISSNFPPRHSLWSYWRLNARNLPPIEANGNEVLPEHGLPHSSDAVADHLVEQLNALSVVDLAYREFEASDPDHLPGSGAGEEPSAEELSDFQLYLDEAPLGLGVRWARAHLASNAVRIGLADIEQGWIPGHEDLPNPLLKHGDNRHLEPDLYLGDHGTAVTSQLVGNHDNQLGVIGIASGVATLSLASHYKKGDGDASASSGRVADAIAALITGDTPVLKPGDVLLLEVQRAGQPEEVNPLTFDAIRLAVAHGIIVVEAAGNGWLNLDRLETVDGRSLNRRSPYFVDSGAILVGAARSAVPHNRSWYSNYGGRVDCFGWGDSVVAAGYGNFSDGIDTSSYTDTFSGTSSAAPMIAGAAALVQSLYAQNASPATGEEKWKRLSPTQMRSLLSEPRTGTRQGRGRRGWIGVMPNLRLVVERSLGIVPQVYLRDHLGDDGQSSRRKFCSPDILLRADGDESNDFIGRGIFSNQDVFEVGLESPGTKNIQVRVCNRGLREATEVSCEIYQAPVSTLVTPDRWRQFPPTASTPDASSLSISNVPQGDVFSLSDSVPFDINERKCLVAVAQYKGGEEGPVPCHKLNFHWGRYLRMMRRQRNVSVRNVYGVEVPSDVNQEPVDLTFDINGTPDAPRLFEFEVIQKLPWETQVEFEAPLPLAYKFSRGRLQKAIVGGADLATIHLGKQPNLSLGSTPLPAAIDFRCHFKLRNTDGLRVGHSLAIRQLYRGEEVGRITWRFSR